MTDNQYFWTKEQGLKNSKLVIEKLKELNMELNGTNYNEARYWIDKLPQYIPTYGEYVTNYTPHTD